MEVHAAFSASLVYLPPFPCPFVAYKDPFFAATSLHGSFLINMHMYAVMQLSNSRYLPTFRPIAQLLKHMERTIRTIYEWIVIYAVHLYTYRAMNVNTNPRMEAL